MREVTIKGAKTFENNPRKITEEKLEQLSDSMHSLGDISGIVYNRRSGQFVGGNQRSKVLGLTQKGAFKATLVEENKTPDEFGTVAVGFVMLGGSRFAFRIVDWPEKKEQFANIAANKMGGEWDVDLLGHWDKDLLLESGFDAAELEKMVPGVLDTSYDEYDIPQQAKEVDISPGDIFEIGPHRLICGDSRNGDHVIALMDGAKADMVFTDPPYGVSIGAKNRMLNSFQRGGRNLSDIKDDSLSPDGLYKMLLPAFVNLRSIMSDDCTVFVTAPQGGDLGMMMMMMKDCGLPVRHVLIWKKNAPTFSMGRLDYDYQHEPILLTWGKRHKYYGKGEHRTSVWEIPKPRSSKEHPTMKPVALVANALLNNSKEGDVICDWYLGSGTTMIAAHQLGRKCFGIEIDPWYCWVIIERMLAFDPNLDVTRNGGKYDHQSANSQG